MNAQFLRNMLPHAILGGAALLCLVPAPLQAQAAPANQLLELSIEDLMEVEVTTASKRPTSVNTTPASVVVITSDEIRRFGYQNLADLLARVTGFYITNDRNYEYLGVRGVSLPGDYTSRVLILVNGHRINDPIYDEAAIGNHLSVDIEDIQRIEIVKGPGSAVWGTNALLGVINITTKSADDLGKARVVANTGSHDLAKGTIQGGHRFENNAEVAASYSGLTTHGERSIYFKEFDDGEISDGNALNLDDERLHHGYLSAKWEDLSFFLTGGTRKKTVPTASYGTLFGSDAMYSVDESIRGELLYDTALGTSSWRAQARTFYDRLTYKGQFPYAMENSSLASLYIDRSRSHHLGSELRFSGKITESVSITAGAEVHRFFELKNFAASITPEYQEDVSTDNSYNATGVFAESEVSLLEDLRVTLGLRDDYYTTVENHLSPRAAVVYTPVTSSSFKLGYGNAFRAPNDYELHYRSGLILGNPNLKPEQIDNTEITWEQQLGQTLHLTTTLFRFKMHDVVGQHTDQDGFLRFENQGHIKSEGLELTGTARLNPKLTGFFGFTYADAEDAEMSHHLTNSPYLVGQLGSSLSLFDGHFAISPELRYLGSRETTQGTELGPMPQWNLTLQGLNLLPNLELSLSIYNLLNNRIEYTGGYEHTQDAIPGLSRTWRAGIAYTF